MVRRRAGNGLVKAALSIAIIFFFDHSTDFLPPPILT
jgi:hypothetical protein